MYKCFENNDECMLDKNVNIPIELYESIKGDYFVGYADELTFKPGNSAWAMLYNPCDSNRNLHVNVWSVTDISKAPFRAQFWFNAIPPGIPTESKLVTPANTTIIPLPKPKIRIEFASDVKGDPIGGVKAFVRRGTPESTLVDTENGKFIFPPGGSFVIMLSTPESPETTGAGRIAFGWWEEKIKDKCID